LLHRPEQLLGANGAALYRALEAVRDSGQVRKIGISVYAPGELAAVMPRFRFDLIQAPFNLVDRRLHEMGWLRRLKDNGVEIHTRSAFLQGLLLMPRQSIPVKFAPWSHLWDRWHEWLAAHHIPAVQACLAFPLSHPEVDRVVVGADSVTQLAEILDAASRVPAELPDLQSTAESLLNPSLWNSL
jgi:hypothetical protein